jgi:hypothetical protein
MLGRLTAGQPYMHTSGVIAPGCLACKAEALRLPPYITAMRLCVQHCALDMVTGSGSSRQRSTLARVGTQYPAASPHSLLWWLSGARLG